MKKFAISCVVAVIVAGMVGSVSAADHVPASTLASMGFSGAHQMSDNDGLAVRGMGTSASVWGQSTASKGDDATSTNGYLASASHRHDSSTAKGSNLSFAGNVRGHGEHISFNFNVAGGSSSAYAK
jgi:hypothetical protein